MSTVRDQALLLRRFPFGESSLVVHLLTRAHGRVHLIAKGAYRPTSRYFAVLDYFDTLEIEWDESPRRELGTMRAGDVLRRRRAVPRDLDAYHCGMTLLELIELVSHPGPSDPELFQLLVDHLDELQSDPARHARTLVVFEGRLLHNLGLAPALAACAACGGAASPVTRDGARVAFSAGAGGRLCSACAVRARAAGRRVGTLPQAVLEDCSRLIQGMDLRALDDRGASPQAATEERIERVREFLQRFIEYHLETRPRTYRALAPATNRRRAQAEPS